MVIKAFKLISRINPKISNYMQKNTLKLAISQSLKDFQTIQISYLFGSSITNRATSTSDIDIAIAANEVLSSKEKLKIQEALTYALKQQIDLIDLNHVSGPILQQALCTGELIFNKAPTLLASIIKRMWFNQADMMPYVERMLNSHCRRYING